MVSLCIEPTNLCNRNCIHCSRDKLEPRESLPLEFIASILQQAKALGIKNICLTGGESTLYPDFKGLVKTIVDLGLNLNMVTNGFRFKDRVLPLLTEPRVKKSFSEVCFSLDGARAESHDAIRGEGSFKEVMEAASLCRLKGLKISLKSLITNFNKGELAELALLGATLGTKEHSFLYPFITPELIKKAVLPTPEELRKLVHWVVSSLKPTLKSWIEIEGYSSSGVLFTCYNILHSLNVDYQGKLILCCNLSHVGDDGIPATTGRELVADLTKESLKDGIVRHFQAVSHLMAARLNDADRLNELTANPCYWCYKHFGKMEWLKNYPESPWAKGVLDNGRA